ncbi:MAG TPA: cupin domain-containing protein [Bacteroidales bacterium]|nr:cupin domain-containing protein [Bacteroidales bacterium]
MEIIRSNFQFSEEVLQNCIQPRKYQKSFASIVNFEPGAKTAWHTHPLGQILFVLSGIGRIQKEGGKVEEIHRGDIIWVDPGEKHWTGASQNIPLSLFKFQDELNSIKGIWPEKDEQ